MRPSILLMPAPSAGLIRELRRLRVGSNFVGSNFVRIPSCTLHTVVATEDPVSLHVSSLSRAAAFLSVCMRVDMSFDHFNPNNFTIFCFENSEFFRV